MASIRSRINIEFLQLDHSKGQPSLKHLPMRTERQGAPILHNFPHLEFVFFYFDSLSMINAHPHYLKWIVLLGVAK